MTLPPFATAASRLRYDLARRLVAGYPATLSREIALTGSVARGTADDDSDIEIMCWVDEEPGDELFVRYLEEVGATAITNSVHNPSDGSRWVTCRLDPVWVEVGWTQIGPFEELVRRLAAGEYMSHTALTAASMVMKAAPLRECGLLARWQQQLASYPDALRAAIIQDNTQAWSDPHVPGVRWALARRDQRMALALRLGWDMQNLLNVLWAVNRVWPQDWKWTDDRTLGVAIAPDDLAARINRVFTFDPPEASVGIAFELIAETLLLVPPQFDVSAALASIRSARRVEDGSHS